MKAIAAEAGLIQDDDPGVYEALDGLLNRVLPLYQKHAQAGAYSAYLKPTVISNRRRGRR